MSIKSIDIEGLKAKLDKNEDLVLVDCREQDEWDAGHIKEAIFLPLSQLEERYTELKDKNSQIILQCRSGKRSMRACEFLQSKDYTDLTNLEGGILAWQEEGHDIEE